MFVKQIFRCPTAVGNIINGIVHNATAAYFKKLKKLIGRIELISAKINGPYEADLFDGLETIENNSSGGLFASF